MNYHTMVHNDKIDFDKMAPGPYLLGVLSAFENQFQAKADTFFVELTWKQFFAIICIQLCKESPTINELSEIMGSSHQNVKQILNKLENKGFVQMVVDEKDKRKQRIVITEKCEAFCRKNEEGRQTQINQIFDGILVEKIVTTIQTIMQMERNLENL